MSVSRWEPRSAAECCIFSTCRSISVKEQGRKLGYANKGPEPSLLDLSHSREPPSFIKKCSSILLIGRSGRGRPGCLSGCTPYGEENSNLRLLKQVVPVHCSGGSEREQRVVCVGCTGQDGEKCESGIFCVSHQLFHEVLRFAVFSFL